LVEEIVDVLTHTGGINTTVINHYSKDIGFETLPHQNKKVIKFATITEIT
jgi:hypothetical protein